MNNGTFISPAPREYSTYSDQEKIEKTEEFYRQMTDLYQRMDKSEKEYVLRIDTLLQKGTTGESLKAILQEKEAQILCYYSYTFYVLELLCKIATIEEKMNERTVLQNFSSMEEGIAWNQKCVFLLRRFEMDWEVDEELLRMMQKKQVSYIMLAELICKEWIFRKIYTGEKVFRYLYENGLKKEALTFLLWLEQRLPYCENKIVFFVKALLDMGEWKIAYEMLLKHQTPDKDIEELQSILQEKCRRYRDE